MEEKITRFLKGLEKINKDNLIAVSIYANNTKLLVLLKVINFDNLLENSQLLRKIQKSGVNPVYLTEEYIRSSCDVFPLEYLQMKENYKVLFGKDIISELHIDSENIRLESEQKIKGALIRLTQVILENGNRMNKLKKTVQFALEDIITGMLGILKLQDSEYKTTDTNTTLTVIKNFEDRFNIDLQVLKKIADWKNLNRSDNEKHLIYDFYEKIEKLANIADAFEITR